MKKLLFVFMAILISIPLFAAQHRVLIVKEDTGYKKALVQALTEELKRDGTEVVVIDHKNGELAGVDPEDYDAVFITNSGVQGRVRPDVVEWLDSVAGRDGNVILHTTQRNDWTPDVSVDSITSASQKSNISELVADIAERIRKFF